MITIFSKVDCGACMQAKMIMDENHIQYNEVMITPETIENYDLTSAPTIIKDDIRIDGYPGSTKLLKLLQE